MKKTRFSVEPSFLIPLFLLFWQSPPVHAFLFFCAVLLHETGHLLCLVFFGYKPKKISLSLTGAAIEIEDRYIPYKKEVCIYLCGPLFGMIGCVFSWMLLRRSFTENGMLFFSFCFLLTLLNLFPVKGLDGGEALYAALCHYGEEWQAQSVTNAVHYASLFILFTASLWLFAMENNPSLLILTFSFALGKTKRKKATNLS